MRILCFQPRLPTFPLDGGAHVLLHQVKQLRALGHHVSVVGPNTSRHHADRDTLHDFADELITVDVNTDVSFKGALRSFIVDPVPQHLGLPRTPYSISRFYNASLREKLRQHILHSEPYDVMLVEYLVMLWYALDVNAQTPNSPVPIIFRAHNIEHRIVRHLAHDKTRSIAERYYRMVLARQMETYERAIVKRPDFIASVSAEDIDWFARVAPNIPRAVIPPGMDIVQIDLNRRSTSERRTVGFLGSLEWQPNVEAILWFTRDVWPLVRKEIPTARFVIAGRSPVNDILRLHNGDDVIVIGPVESATEFLSTIDVAIAPALSGSGVRIKILEGLAHGLPMVANSLGAEGLHVVHGEHLLIADAETEFAKCCTNLLHDAALAQRIGKSGQDLIQREYSWNRTTQLLLDAYASIAS